MKKYNILVFPCGSEIALELHNSLKYHKDINLIGVSSVSDHGKYVYSNYIGNCPYIDDKCFIDFIKQAVKDNNIDFIYPCLDVAIEKLKQQEQELNCKVIGSPHHTNNIFLSKKKTYEYFKDILLVPELLDHNNIKKYPVFSKPEIGSSSRGTVKIDNEEDLFYWMKKYPKNLILEYLPGDEYTVDCFTSKNRELKFIGPRRRSRISNGISVGTSVIQDKEIDEIAHNINNNIEINGAWFFQIKKDINNKYKLLEIASRFAGSSAIHRILGINFAYLNILNEIYDDLNVIYNKMPISTDRSLNTKYQLHLNFKSAYIDLDDTLIINNKINLDMIKFVYNCNNNNIKTYLITRHAKNINNTLKKYKINSKLFSSIIHLTNNEKKSYYINDELPIFIDDSFSERSEVFKELGIPVFSPDCVEGLL